MCDNYCHADKDRQVAKLLHQDKVVMHRCKQALPGQASGGATSMSDGAPQESMCDVYCHADKDRQVVKAQHQDKLVMHRCKQALPEQASGGATSM